jgi:hypothetical protein
VILKDTGSEDMDWINVAHDKDQWWILVNTIVKPRVSLEARNVFTD